MWFEDHARENVAALQNNLRLCFLDSLRQKVPEALLNLRLREARCVVPRHIYKLRINNRNLKSRKKISCEGFRGLNWTELPSAWRLVWLDDGKMRIRSREV